MIAALTYPSNADRYVAQVVGIEPCLIPDVSAFGFPGLDRTAYEALSVAVNLLGWTSMFGPDWASQIA